jgi:uncharacterized membrane protein HdeD (DUF308 family)
MVAALVRYWWVLIVQGVLAVLFGVAALLMPGLTLASLVAFFGIMAILDGAIALVGAFAVAGSGAPRWLFALRGVVGVAAGLAAFAWPAMTALALIYVVAARFVATGILEIVGAVALRKEIDGEWLLILSGVLSILAGAWFFLAPGDGALALAWLIGLFAVAIGAALIAGGVRLRGIAARSGSSERASPA